MINDRLTPEEIESLRAETQRDGEWARVELQRQAALTDPSLLTPEELAALRAHKAACIDFGEQAFRNLPPDACTSTKLP